MNLEPLNFEPLSNAEIAIMMLLACCYPKTLLHQLIQHYPASNLGISKEAIDVALQDLVTKGLIIKQQCGNSLYYKQQHLSFYRQEKQTAILAINDLVYFGASSRIEDYLKSFLPKKPLEKHRHPMATDISSIIALRDEGVSPEGIAQALKLTLGYMRSIIRNDYIIDAKGRVAFKPREVA